MMAQLKLYTNGHIARQIVVQLRKHHVDIVRCEDVGMKNASDEEHLRYAIGEKRAIVTGDTDFIVFDTLYHQTGKTHFGIFYLVPSLLGNISIPVKTLLFWHEAIAAGAATLEDDVYNHVIYIQRI